MPKNLLQDMVRPKTIKEKNYFNNIEVIKNRPIEKTPEGKEPAGGSKYALWFVAIFSIVFLIFAISMFFASASITINPKEKDFDLNSSFIAVKDASGTNLSFDLVALSGEETKSIPANGTKDIDIKAIGKIRIYNNYSSTPQILAANTRLEGLNGKIYRTDSKVSVPGFLKKDTPGSTEVGIYGAVAGEEYNSAPLDFKILAFKNSTKYLKIYGRSVGNITGGFKGQVPNITDVDKTSTLAELQIALQAKLLKQIDPPDGFILFKDAIYLDITADSTPPQIKDSNAIITVKGKLYGFILNEKNLTRALVKNLIPDYDGSDVFIPNIKDLVFSLSSKEYHSFSTAKSITFTLVGKPKVVWRVDADKLSDDLLGTNKKDFNNALSKYLNIASADLVIRPAWKSSFPDKKKDIKVIVNYPN